MKVSGQTVWRCLIGNQLPEVREYLRGLPDERISQRRPKCPVKYNPEDFTKVREVLARCSSGIAAWVVMLVVFIGQGFWLYKEHWDKFVDGLRESVELRTYFLRQGLQTLLPREAWLGIHGTPEWQTLEKVPGVSDRGHLLEIHVVKSIPIPDDPDYNYIVLGNATKSLGLARLVRRNADKFLQLAKKDKECIGFLFYVGLLDEDEVLSKMLAVKGSEWTRLSIMAIERLIPTIVKNVLKHDLHFYSYRKISQQFEGVPLEELKVWHTHVRDLPIQLVVSSLKLRAHFIPDIVTSVDTLWYESSKDNYSSLEDLRMLVQGFNRRILEWTRKEESNDEGKLRKKILSWAGKLQAPQKIDQLVCFCLFAVAPCVIESTVRDRTTPQNWIGICQMTAILRKIVLEQERDIPRTMSRMAENVSRILNTSAFLHYLVKWTGRVHWNLSAEEAPCVINITNFLYKLGRIDVAPQDWRAEMFIRMHNTMVEPVEQRDAWEDSTGRILELVEQNAGESKHFAEFTSRWLYNSFKTKIVSEEVLKQFVERLPDVVRADLKGTRIPNTIKEQLRSLFEEDENRQLLRQLNERMDAAIEGVDESSEFGKELGKRLRKATTLEKIAKKQIIKCQSCTTIGGIALAKETSCCRKVLCGRCSTRTAVEMKCVACQKEKPVMRQMTEVDVGLQLETVFAE